MALAIYGTVVFSIKAILAIIHHFKWMFCIMCCHTKFNENRKRMIDEYWKKENLAWK